MRGEIRILDHGIAAMKYPYVRLASADSTWKFPKKKNNKRKKHVEKLVAPLSLRHGMTLFGGIN